MTNPFVQGGGERLFVRSLLGASVGFLLGLLVAGIAGALLGAFLGILVIRRIGLIRPRLPRERQVVMEEHPTHQARQRIPSEAVTWAPIQKSPDDPYR
jgi:ABC-type lipoprotein release transport system permease subunit